MGQKVNPIGIRIGSVYTWSSRWFAKKGDYSKFLLEDYRIREFLMKRLKSAGVSKIEIERFFDKKTITAHVSRPGVAIGRGGADAGKLKNELVKKFKVKDSGKLDIKFVEVKNPDLDAYLIAVNIADQLERRFLFSLVTNQAS